MRQKTTLATLNQFKRDGRPITMLTCYDAMTAGVLQESEVDILLVGDSLAQMILGYDSTLPATMDLMVAFAAAVRRGAPGVYLAGDMPFLSYQVSRESAIANAGRFLVEAGCDVVKLEVDGRNCDLVANLAAAGIPVMAHMGYRPQWAAQNDKIVGTREVEQACQLVQDAQAMIEAGACSLLLECVTTEVARVITERADVPVISCGSGAGCDGQILVINDVMGLPGAGGARFAKQYTQLGAQMAEAARAYVEDVQQNRFPDDQHSYHMPAEQLEQFRKRISKSD